MPCRHPGSTTARVRLTTEIAVAVAMAAVLSLFRIKLPHLVYGGSVSLHTIPVFVVALRQGAGPGLAVGVCYGVVNFLMTPFFVHPIQLLLDYPVAFGALGLAGLATAFGSHRLVTATAVIAASTVRLASHVLSGIVYFGDLAPEGTPAWQYSLVYNSSYIVPETVLAVAVTALIVRRLGGSGGFAHKETRP